jgi:hypothetical protein
LAEQPYWPPARLGEGRSRRITPVRLTGNDRRGRRVPATRNARRYGKSDNLVERQEAIGAIYRLRPSLASLCLLQISCEAIYRGVERGDGDRNNLIFVEEYAYNYDRPRIPGEGIDWGRKPYR